MFIIKDGNSFVNVNLFLICKFYSWFISFNGNMRRLVGIVLILFFKVKVKCSWFRFMGKYEWKKI